MSISNNTRSIILGFVVGIAVMLLLVLLVNDYNKQKESADYVESLPQARAFSATALTKDAVTLKVTVVARTKLDPTINPLLVSESRRAIRSIVSRYMYEKDEVKMVLKLRQEFPKLMGFGCEDALMDVIISRP